MLLMPAKFEIMEDDSLTKKQFLGFSFDWRNDIQFQTTIDQQRNEDINSWWEYLVSFNLHDIIGILALRGSRQWILVQSATLKGASK